jgi:YjbE family integral membrane protein
MEALFSTQMVALLTVIGIDLVLSGDNAVVIGTAAAGLSPDLRRRAIVIGIIVAALTRMAFAMVAFYLLKVVGLLFVGGLLLAWVTWTMWRQIGSSLAEVDPITEKEIDDAGPLPTDQARGRFRKALLAIVLADVSMSLDNVLAVAGAAKDHAAVLVFGLALSIALMGVAANLIASVIGRYRWIAYVGVILVAYVSVDMIWRGGLELVTEVQAMMD